MNRESHHEALSDCPVAGKASVSSPGAGGAGCARLPQALVMRTHSRQECVSLGPSHLSPLVPVISSVFLLSCECGHTVMVCGSATSAHFRLFLQPVCLFPGRPRVYKESERQSAEVSIEVSGYFAAEGPSGRDTVLGPTSMQRVCVPGSVPSTSPGTPPSTLPMSCGRWVPPCPTHMPGNTWPGSVTGSLASGRSSEREKLSSLAGSGMCP